MQVRCLLRLPAARLMDAVIDASWPHGDLWDQCACPPARATHTPPPAAAVSRASQLRDCERWRSARRAVFGGRPGLRDERGLIQTTGTVAASLPKGARHGTDA